MKNKFGSVYVIIVHILYILFIYFFAFYVNSYLPKLYFIPNLYIRIFIMIIFIVHYYIYILSRFTIIKIEGHYILFKTINPFMKKKIISLKDCTKVVATRNTFLNSLVFYFEKKFIEIKLNMNPPEFNALLDNLQEKKIPLEMSYQTDFKAR